MYVCIYIWRFPKSKMKVLQATIVFQYLVMVLHDLDDLGYPYLRKPSYIEILCDISSSKQNHYITPDAFFANAFFFSRW